MHPLVADALDALDDYPVFLAYNANVDAIRHVDDALLERLPAPEREPTDPPSPHLGSWSDLAAALARTMHYGNGDEYPLTDAFAAELAATLEADEERLGGQAGIMTDVLSVLGAAPVFYSYLLSERQRDVFTRPDAVRVPAVADAGPPALTYRRLSELTADGRTKVNWIFEFDEGQHFGDVVAAGDTRLVAASRPDDFDLRASFDPVVEALAADVGCALLSGYHSLKREYHDSTDFTDHLPHAADVLRRFRAASDAPVQLEYGVSHYPDLRAGIHEHVVPHVDSLGLDTHELNQICDDLDVGVSLDPGTGTGTDPETETAADRAVSRYRACEAVRDALDLGGVALHATDYFVVARAPDYLAPEPLRDGLVTAAVVAAAKATDGAVHSTDDLRDGVACDPAPAGEAAVDAVAHHLGREAMRDDDGLAAPEAACVANRVVADPQSTVGLGDAVSAVSFAVACALNDRDDRTGE